MDPLVIGTVPSYDYSQATIQIVNTDVEAGFVLINKEDFDPKQHKPYSEKAKPKKKADDTDGLLQGGEGDGAAA
ncbi:hypothetical protein JFK97_05890 [Chromobacterium phragmitis]|uniref:hypothetical protein n=1 Tax=Chromobacterium amazonense TaxID=1382803 RepID=UPI0021B7864D|nr:hypothetical protein [Chromobacterium amazonense]MBM2883916.1 hypothetical protein [Chromobacterium amazonense]MDE1711833.1 hypothetical protein [Chromobacterium amazonense]